MKVMYIRPAKSRDRCDRRSREIFIFLGNLGKFYIFPSGNCHISPLKSSPFGKFLMFLVGKLLFNKHTNKIRLFMWLLQETNKFFAKCCSFYLRPFWGNFNPRNTGWGKFFTFCRSAFIQTNDYSAKKNIWQRIQRTVFLFNIRNRYGIEMQRCGKTLIFRSFNLMRQFLRNY